MTTIGFEGLAKFALAVRGRALLGLGDRSLSEDLQSIEAGRAISVVAVGGLSCNLRDYCDGPDCCRRLSKATAGARGGDACAT